MIASKGQSVRLIGQSDTATVVLVIGGPGYEALSEGERGVKLSKPLDGSVWTTEEQIEAAS